MTPRLPGLEAPRTIASPCCPFQTPCQPRGRATIGPERIMDGCVNRFITCECGRQVDESRNTSGRSGVRRESEDA